MTHVAVATLVRHSSEKVAASASDLVTSSTIMPVSTIAPCTYALELLSQQSNSGFLLDASDYLQHCCSEPVLPGLASAT